MGWAKAANEQHTSSLLKTALGWNYNLLAAGQTAVQGIQELPASFSSAEVRLPINNSHDIQSCFKAVQTGIVYWF